MKHAIDIKERKKLLGEKEPMTLLDVRRKADYQANPNTIKGAVWRAPDKINDWVKQLPSDHYTPRPHSKFIYSGRVPKHYRQRGLPRLHIGKMELFLL